MTQRSDAHRTRRQRASQRALMQGLGWLGGVGMLSSGMVFAQTPASDAPSVPSAQDLLAPAQPAAEPPAPAPVVVTPERSAPERTTEAAPRPEATAETTPKPAAIASPEMVNPSLSENAQNLGPQDTPYIDSTDYSLGATPSRGQVNVELSERSTGCRAVLRAGQSVPNSICATRPGSGAIATGGRTLPGNVNSISIGPIRVGSNGIQIARNYYNVTARPMGLPGNGNMALMFPLSIPSSITSAFGWRVHPITGSARFHYGTDLGAPMGTPVLAAYTGRVSNADFMQGYGLTVVLRHGNPDAETLYAHLSEIFVQPGEQVQQGQVIGRVGSTGLSTGPHLHFEFRQRTEQGWVAMNPGMLLQQALGNFAQNFQLAQLPGKPIASEASDETLVAFRLQGLTKLLTALQKDPNTLKFAQLAKFNEGAIALDYDLYDPRQEKGWDKENDEIAGLQ